MRSNVIPLYSQPSANTFDYATVVSSPLDAEIILDDLIASMKHQLHEVKRASRYCKRLAEFKMPHEKPSLLHLSEEYQAIHARYKSQLLQLVECAL